MNYKLCGKIHAIQMFCHIMKRNFIVLIKIGFQKHSHFAKESIT